MMLEYFQLLLLFCCVLRILRNIKILKTVSAHRFYERMIPVADELYDVYLKELKQEGLLK